MAGVVANMVIYMMCLGCVGCVGVGGEWGGSGQLDIQGDVCVCGGGRGTDGLVDASPLPR